MVSSMFDACTIGNHTCFNHGQCKISENNESWSCLCAPCYQGPKCEQYDSILEKTFPLTILINIEQSTAVNSKVLYVFLMSMMLLVGLINNIRTLQTILSKRIRSSCSGFYLLTFTICAIYVTIWSYVRTIVTFYGVKSIIHSYTYQSFNCHVFPTVNAILASISLWVSAFLAIHRALIELFFVRAFGVTRKHAVIVSLTLTLLVTFSRVPTMLGKRVLPNFVDNSSYECQFINSNLLIRLEQIQAWINMFGPCCVHFFSNILTCIKIVQRKMQLTSGNSRPLTYRQAWLQQISLHRDYFIGPTVILLCQLPHLIYFAVTNTMKICIESKLGPYSHMNILISVLIYTPQTLTFVIFIFPSKYYLNEFYSSTSIGRLLNKIHS